MKYIIPICLFADSRRCQQTIMWKAGSYSSPLYLKLNYIQPQMAIIRQCFLHQEVMVHIDAQESF